MSQRASSLFPAATPWGVALALALVSACSSVDVSSEVRTADVSLSEYASFAWAGGPGLGDQALEARLRDGVESELTALGMAVVEPEEADLLVSYETRVESKDRQNDPYFAMYAGERHELGTLTIRLRDRVANEVIWLGSGTSELRRSGVVTGPFAPRMKPTHDPRDWSLDEKVRRIFQELRRDLADGGERRS